MRTSLTTSGRKTKSDAVAGLQLALRETLATLEAERARTDDEIRRVRSALAAMGLQNPHLAARAKRKPMSAAERRDVSKRMKAYWAKRRSAKPA